MKEGESENKSADQILEELFTSLGTAPPDVEPSPPGDESRQTTPPPSASNKGVDTESIKAKKRKKDKKKKKKKRKKSSRDENDEKVKEKKAKKKDRRDDEKEIKTRTEDENASDPKIKKIRTEEEVAEPEKVAKPEKKEQLDRALEPKNRSPSRISKDAAPKLSDESRRREPERRRSRERESIRAGRISPSSRRRASRSPVHKRRPLISSRRRSRSRSRSPSSRRRHLGVNRNRPVLDRRRSRTPPHRRRRSRSRSPIELKRAERAPSPARSPRIDKAQLLEVARQNLKRMQELGTLPANLTLPSSLTESGETVSVKVSQSTGKTVAELTNYCKNLVAQPEDTEIRNTNGSKEADDSSSSTSFTRHPFQLKTRSDVIVMNIRNSVALPIRKPEERATLKQQFPISSGQQHLELEWVPVPVPAPEKESTRKKPSVSKPNAIVSPTPRVAQSVAEQLTTNMNSQRFASVRKSQENQEEIESPLASHEAGTVTQSWVTYQQTNPLTGEPMPELINWSGAPQAWVRKDQFSNAAPVAGGVGMRLLQKMGWQPGEGLGRNKEGALEPLALDIKMDKKGLLSKEEMAPPKASVTNKLMQEFQGKHPVSILHELCVKKRWEPPDFEQVADMGPDHLKHFLFKVRVNGMDYQPSVASTTKKEAKAQAAAVCLLSLGVRCPNV